MTWGRPGERGWDPRAYWNEPDHADRDRDQLHVSVRGSSYTKFCEQLVPGLPFATRHGQPEALAAEPFGVLYRKHVPGGFPEAGVGWNRRGGGAAPHARDGTPTLLH